MNTLKWHDPVTIKVQDLLCSLCRRPIGKKRWAIFWKGKRSLRLCEPCGEKLDTS